jgi:hypothetical protein
MWEGGEFCQNCPEVRSTDLRRPVRYLPFLLLPQTRHGEQAIRSLIGSADNVSGSRALAVLFHRKRGRYCELHPEGEGDIQREYVFVPLTM